MKKTLSLLLCLFLTVCLLPTAGLVSSAAEEGEPETWNLNGFNTVCRTGFAVVYTEAGSQTGTDEKCIDVLVGADGKILSVEKNNATVPENGFVLSGSGVKKKKLQSLEPGDGVLLTRNGNGGTVTLVTKAYNPFSESSVPYNARNSTRSADTVIVYDTGTSTRTNEWGYEVSVDKNGTVISLGGNDSPIPEGGFVLSGHGKGKTALEEAAKLGMSVRLDTDNKTILFRVDADSYRKAYELRVQGYEEQKQAADKACLVLDNEAVGQSLDRLKARCDEIAAALANDDRVALYMKEAAFESEAETLSGLLTESDPAELRAVWIRPDLVTDKSAVLQTVKGIYEAGFNQVYIEILFDNTLIYPPAEGSLYEQNPKLNGFDLLQAYIDACHAYRIELHAWYSVMRVGTVGSANSARSVAAKKPEWRNIQKNGTDTVTNVYGTAYFLNPALPEVRAFLTDHVKDLVSRYPLDGLHLDYIRYPNNEGGEDFGYDETTVRLYKEKTGTDPKTLPTGNASFAQFRADFVTETVRSIRKAVSELRPDLWLSAAVAPNYANSLKSHQQDTKTWIREKLIDIVMPMAYGTVSVVESNTKTNAELLEVDAALYLLPGVSDYGADAFIEQTKAARANGSDGIAFFSWTPYAASYTNGYEKASAVLFGQPTNAPTWNTAAAMKAQLDLLLNRLNGPLKDNGLTNLKEAASTLRTALDSRSVSGCKAEWTVLQSAFDSAKKNLSAEAAATLGKDILSLRKMMNLNRDDAKETYLSSHPLPESLITDKSGDESGDPETSSETESSEEEKKTVELNTFEKIMQVAAMVILIGGVLLLPLYYVLNKRRKKIIRSFWDGGSEPDKPDDSGQSGDPEPSENPEEEKPDSKDPSD